MKLGIEIMFDVGNACACLKEDAGTEREWTAIGPLDMDGDTEVVAEHMAYCHPRNAPLFAAAPELKHALEDVELRCTQARIASDIGNESGLKKAGFLRGELERIGKAAREALNKAEGTTSGV